MHLCSGDGVGAVMLRGGHGNCLLPWFSVCVRDIGVSFSLAAVGPIAPLLLDVIA